MLCVARAGERKTFEHRYGVFDEHMDEGEELTFRLLSAEDVTKSEGSDDVSIEVVAAAGAGAGAATTIGATEVNERFALPLEMPNDNGAVHVGSVSLLNDYMMVARDADGAITEAFMRL